MLSPLVLQVSLSVVDIFIRWFIFCLVLVMADSFRLSFLIIIETAEFISLKIQNYNSKNKV